MYEQQAKRVEIKVRQTIMHVSVFISEVYGLFEN